MKNAPRLLLHGEHVTEAALTKKAIYSSSGLSSQIVRSGFSQNASQAHMWESHRDKSIFDI